jgi:NADPH:quinone reductase
MGGNELWLANAAVLGLNAGGLLAEHPDRGRSAARQALRLLLSGDLVVEYTTLPLEGAAEAHRRLEAGGADRRLLLAV